MYVFQLNIFIEVEYLNGMIEIYSRTLYTVWFYADSSLIQISLCYVQFILWNIFSK